MGSRPHAQQQQLHRAGRSDSGKRYRPAPPARRFAARGGAGTCPSPAGSARPSAAGRISPAVSSQDWRHGVPHAPPGPVRAVSAGASSHSGIRGVSRRSRRRSPDAPPAAPGAPPGGRPAVCRPGAAALLVRGCFCSHRSLLVVSVCHRRQNSYKLLPFPVIIPSFSDTPVNTKIVQNMSSISCVSGNFQTTGCMARAPRRPPLPPPAGAGEIFPAARIFRLTPPRVVYNGGS